jgi:hypothetical protein
MNQKVLIFLLFISVFFPSSIFTQDDDTTLYVKTIYAHEIYNGRNTAQKYALKQEMFNAKGELFREVFYDKASKQVDYTLYYYYNPDKTIRSIERVDINEQPTGYFKYQYKGGKLKSVEFYNYNRNTKSPELSTIKKFNIGKDKTEIITCDKNKNIIESVTKIYKNGLLENEKVLNNKSDSCYLKILERSYSDTLLTFEKESEISKDNDTNLITLQYKYNDKNQLDSIITTNKAEGIRYTIFNYFKNGSLESKITINKNSFYFENITYDLKKYYRKLPYKKPQF